MGRIAVVGVVAALVGCSGPAREPDDEPQDCAMRSGTFSTVFTVRSGNCGDIPEQVTVETEQPTEVEAPCAGTISYSADNCEVTAEWGCAEDTLGAGWTSESELHADWNEAGTRGTAVQQIVIRNETGAVVCQGTYDLTITRL